MEPKRLTKAFAEEGLKNTIPEVATESTAANAATYSKGFPATTMTPIAVGGQPPSGKDMNGILYELSSHIAYMNKGGQYKFDADFCEEIGGYDAGAVVQSDDGLSLYVNQVLKNKTNPNSQNSKGWKVVANSGFGEEISQKVHTIASIAALREYTGTADAVNVKAYYDNGTTGGGLFVADKTDKSSADNGGTVIVSGNGARWKRQVTVVTPQMFGARADGVRDDTLSIQAALDTGLNVSLPTTSAYYAVTDTLRMVKDGQVFAGESGSRRQIRNLTNDKPLFTFGNTNMSQGHIKQAALKNIGFAGNSTTTAGVILPSLGQNPKWSDASKDNLVDGVKIDDIGAGWALECWSWCNEIINFTAYEGCKKGVWLTHSANQNNLMGIYLTGCNDVSFKIGGDGSGRINAGNLINGLVVQQSGGADGCVDIADARNTVINGLYSEHNNAKGARCIVNIRDSAMATSINGINHHTGGAIVVDNSGISTVVSAVASSPVTGAVVKHNRGSIVVTGVNIISGSATKFVDASNPKTGLYIDGDGIDRLSILSPTPTLNFKESSGREVEMKLDSGVLRTRFGATNLFYFNPSTPEMVVKGLLRSEDDNVHYLGSSSRRWATAYFASAPIVTSDARAKQDIDSIPAAVIDAWRSVQWQQYRWRDAVAEKGAGARYHTGLIAQSIKSAFDAHGLDAQDYGLLCYDQWPETPAREAVVDEAGNVLEEAVAYQPAGERWGIRADECLFLEAESNRRLIADLAKRIEKLESV